MTKSPRNAQEVVEELAPDIAYESDIVLVSARLKLSRNKERRSETSSRSPGKRENRKKSHAGPLGAACCFEEREHRDCRSEIHPVARLSVVAKPSGTPKSLIVTRPAALARALRASRSAHERR